MEAQDIADLVESTPDFGIFKLTQAAHDVAKPLATLKPAERDKMLAQICEKIAAAANV